MKTLGLRWPFGRVALHALGLLAAFCLLVELLVRMPGAESVLPDESYGSSHAHFNTQLSRIRARVQQDGRLDCIFMGDSQVLHDIDPALVEAQLSGRLNRPVRCQNFGLGGMSLLGADQLARILIERFQPRVVVLGVSELSFIHSSMDSSGLSIFSSPWVQQQLGKPSLDGWLFENSSAYRHYLGATARVFDNFVQNPEIQPDGYSVKFADKSTMSLADQVVYFKQYYSRPTVSQSHLDAFGEMLALDSARTRIAVVEMPIDPQYFSLNKPLQRHFDEYRQRLQQTALAAGISVWLTQDSLKLPEDAWHDLIHLARPGTLVISPWIADQLASILMDPGTTLN
jgi:hypothetical protein